MGHKFDPQHSESLGSLEREEWENPGAWLNQLGIPSGARVLDIGIGVGFYLKYIHQLIGQGGCIVGTDISREMLKQAREISRPFTHVCLVQTDESVLPFVGGIFDVVLMAHIAHELDEPLAMYREIHRVIKKKGVLWVWDWSPEGHLEQGPPQEHRVGVDWVVNQLEQGGFRAREVSSWLEDHYLIQAHPLEMGSRVRKG